MKVVFDVSPSTPLAKLKSLFAGYPEHLAVVNDDIAALDGGDVDVHFCHFLMHTPLSLAIRLHRTRIVEHLIFNRNVNVGYVTALAASDGNAACMALLMRAGVNLNETFQGQTLCHLAAMNSDAAVLHLLVDAGVPCDEKNDGYSVSLRPIHEAARNANEQVMAILLAAGCKCDAGVAFFAAGNENEKVLAMVIAAGTNVSAIFGARRYVLSQFPIHAAAANQNVAVVRSLIAAGVDVNVVAGDGENPLFAACSNPNEQVLDALLAAGAEWRGAGRRRTICHAAARNTNSAIMRRVIERDVDVEARDSDSRTPLLLAAQFGSAETVQLLLDAGADIEARDSSGYGVCQYACENKDARVTSVLLSAGAWLVQISLETALSLPSSKLDFLRAIVDGGVDVVREPDEHPKVAARATREALQFLIRRGANIRKIGAKLVQTASADCLAVLFAHGIAISDRLQPAGNDSDIFVTLVAAGIDVSGLREFFNGDSDDSDDGDVADDGDDEAHLAAAVGNLHVPVDKVSWRSLAWACNRIAERQFELIRLRAFQICVGLQARQLPALVSCEILAHAFAPLESLVAFHRVWAIVTKIKHFHK